MYALTEKKKSENFGECIGEMERKIFFVTVNIFPMASVKILFLNTGRIVKVSIMLYTGDITITYYFIAT